MTKRTLFCLSTLTFISSTACGALTREEANEALEETKVASQAQALTSQSVELSTNFTIGGAVENAAAELRSFITSQMPCAEVTLELAGGSANLTIEYGANAGNCTFRGHTFSGRHLVSVAKNDEDLVQVDHVWEGLSNGKVNLDGSATVEWDFENKSRHVVHNAVWTRLSDGRSGEGSGDRIQRPLDGGLIEGFSVDGKRAWKGESGDWDLDIDNVEMRWVDPVPQAGKYTLDTPFDKQLTLEFERVSATSIQVTVAGPRREFGFKVLTLPGGDEITEQMPDAEDEAVDE
jgi:hypothetical protein